MLAPEYRTRDKAYGVALKLLSITATNLRKFNMWAGGIGVIVHFLKKRPGRSDGDWTEPPSWKAHKRIYECRDTMTLQSHFNQLWHDCPPHEPLQVGVWLFNLVPDEVHSLSLFENDETRHRVSVVMDELNRRFGQHTIYLGGLHGLRNAAPTRISFTSIPELVDF